MEGGSEMTETIAEYEEKSLTLVEQAVELKIKSAKDFELGGEISASLKKLEREISAYWENSVKSAKIAYDTQRDLRDADLKPIQNARKDLDIICGEWKMEQDKNARIEQARLEREAQEKADRERQKLLDKAAAEADEKKKEKLLDRAEIIVAKPVFVPTVEKSTRLAGGGVRTWIKDISVEVDNIKDVCLAVVNGFIPTSCIEFKNLKAWAKSNNHTADVYGLKITETSRPSTRA